MITSLNWASQCLKVEVLNLILPNKFSIAKYTYLALCVGIGLSFSVTAGERVNYFPTTEDKPKRVADNEQSLEDNEKEGLQQTLNLNFSPEHREKLRKVLDDYARSADPSHELIEERRRVMQQSIEARFLDADNDSDGTLDRQEATEKLPQIARHFNDVDINQDNLISLAELEEALTRISERRKAAEASLEAEKQKKLLEAESPPSTKRKSKQSTNHLKKRAL